MAVIERLEKVFHVVKSIKSRIEFVQSKILDAKTSHMWWGNHVSQARQEIQDTNSGAALAVGFRFEQNNWTVTSRSEEQPVELQRLARGNSNEKLRLAHLMNVLLRLRVQIAVRTTNAILARFLWMVCVMWRAGDGEWQGWVCKFVYWLSLIVQSSAGFLRIVEKRNESCLISKN